MLEIILFVITAVVAVASSIAALKLRGSKVAFLDLLGDLSEFIIFAHALGTREKALTEANVKELADRSEEIWTELKVLGPKITKFLESKEPKVI